MIKIALVEDEVLEQSKINSLLKNLEEKIEDKIYLSVFGDGSKFLFNFEYGKFDIILMDIELGKDENGIKISQKIREIDKDVFIIFISNLVQYAIEGYTVNAIDYLVKPYSEADFENRLISVIKKVNNLHFEKVLLSTNGSKIIVLIKDIIYIEVSSHKLIYHTTNNGDITVYGSLKDISNDLEKHSFSMCNSCFLVNLNYVEKIDGYTVIVKGKELLISHPKRKKFLQDLNIFLGIN